jgi:hypothetical protein
MHGLRVPLRRSNPEFPQVQITYSISYDKCSFSAALTPPDLGMHHVLFALHQLLSASLLRYIGDVLH